MSVKGRAGALIAAERGSDEVWRYLQEELAGGSQPVTHGGIVGQVWRDGAGQAHLARALEFTTVVPLTRELGKDAGRLLAESDMSDVLDAALVTIANDVDRILTSDPGDMALLLAARGVEAEIVPI